MRERGCVCVWLMWFMAVLIYQGNIQVMIVLTFWLNKSGTQPVRSKCRNECCNFWSHPIFWVARNMSESHKKMRWGSRWVVIMEFFVTHQHPHPMIQDLMVLLLAFWQRSWMRQGFFTPWWWKQRRFPRVQRVPWVIKSVDFLPSKVVEDGKILRLKVSTLVRGNSSMVLLCM